jgi:hypothetical protein
MTQDTGSDEMLEAAARAYARGLPELPAALDDRVMAAVRGRPAPAVPRARRLPNVWRWLVEPQQVRPAFAVPLAAAAAVALFVVARQTAPRDAAAPVAAAALPSDTIYVRFELAAPAAQNVALAGTFNGWGERSIVLARGVGGTWAVTVPLPVGEHRYQFVVDGERWVSDPTAHAQVADGFGGTNSVIVVSPRGVVRS